MVSPLASDIGEVDMNHRTFKETEALNAQCQMDREWSGLDAVQVWYMDFRRALPSQANSAE